MSHHKYVRKLAGFLLIVTILFLINDNFDWKEWFVHEEKGEVVIKSGKPTVTLNYKPERPLKVEFVYINKSLVHRWVKIAVENVDTVPGDVTVELSCVFPPSRTNLTYYIEPKEIKLYEFTKLSGRCDDYEIMPWNVSS